MIKSFAHDAIDAVQKVKLQYVNTFVKHDTLADTFSKYIESQTEYTKLVIDTNIDVLTEIGLSVSKKDFAQEVISAYGFDKFFTTPATKGKTVKIASKKAE